MPLENIDEEIRTEYRRIYGAAETRSDRSEPAEAEAEKTVESTPEVVPDAANGTTKSEPVRDETGKFTKKEPAKESEVSEAASQSPTSIEAKSSTTPTPEPSETPVRDINRPPSSWKPAAKATWDKLPPEIRAEVHRRESDFLKGQHGLLPDAELGRSMRQVIDPYRMLIDAEGGTPERAVSDLLRTASLLRMGTPEQKQQLIVKLAGQYGITLPSGQTQGQFQGQTQPNGQSLQDPRVDQLFQYLQTQEQQRAYQEQSQVEGIAANWIDEKDATGKPLRPYLDDVMPGMNVRVPQIRQSNPSLTHKEVLQQAYEQEIWAHPEIRSVLMKEQQEALEASRRTENQERVNLAKKAASVNVPRRGSTLTPAKPGSMEETIRKEALRLGLTN